MTGFVITWQRDMSVDCSDVDNGSITETGSFTSYTLTGLEPGNRYNITVAASNTAGSGPVSNAVTAMTTEPSSGTLPDMVMLVAVGVESRDGAEGTVRDKIWSSYTHTDWKQVVLCAHFHVKATNLHTL